MPSLLFRDVLLCLRPPKCLRLPLAVDVIQLWLMPSLSTPSLIAGFHGFGVGVGCWFGGTDTGSEAVYVINSTMTRRQSIVGMSDVVALDEYGGFRVGACVGHG